MAARRRKFGRPAAKRRYRKLFVISAEGKKTEPQYFALFNSKSFVIHVHCLKPKGGSSPDKVLKSMRKYISDESFRKTDEAWLVVDKDDWSEEQLSELYEWSKSKENYGLAVSNPKFEYWLLLHFEDGNGVHNSRECSDRLARALPGYDKGIKAKDFTSARIADAIRRSERRDTPPCEDWPRGTGTTAYRLVQLLTGNKSE